MLTAFCQSDNLKHSDLHSIQLAQFRCFSVGDHLLATDFACRLLNADTVGASISRCNKMPPRCSGIRPMQ